MSERFEVLNDGPSRWVLVDHENADDPAPVYRTEREAENAMLVRGIEAMGGIESIKYDEDTGRPYRTFTIKL